MEENLDQLIHWIEALPAVWIYVFVFTVAFVEHVFPPVPGDTLIVFCGYLVGRDLVSFGGIWLLATLGGALGFVGVFTMGRTLGGRALASERFPWLPRTKIRRVLTWLDRWGYGLVAVNRFLGGTRFAIGLGSGMSQMTPWKAYACAALSMAAWGLLLVGAGALLGESWPLIERYLALYGRVILVMLAAAAGAVFVWNLIKSQREATTTGD